MVEIVVALISAAAVVWVGWATVRRPMKNEHAATHEILGEIQGKVGHIAGQVDVIKAETQENGRKLDRHLNDHATGEFHT